MKKLVDYYTLCDSRVSICLLVGGILDSSLNRLCRIYCRSYSYHIRSHLSNKRTVHYRKATKSVLAVDSDDYFLIISEILNIVLRPISCECIAIFCIPTPIELIQLGIKTRSNS